MRKTAELLKCQAALRKYGRHKDGCAYLRSLEHRVIHGNAFPVARCTCGLDAALQALPERPAGDFRDGNKDILKCHRCGNIWSVEFPLGATAACPVCERPATDPDVVAALEAAEVELATRTTMKRALDQVRAALALLRSERPAAVGADEGGE